MNPEKFREIFVRASEELADEHYPKGDDRRKGYLRDQAVLYSRLWGRLEPVFASMAAIGAEMTSQSNRSTQYPLFAVEEDQRIYVGHDGDWDGRELDDESSELCESCSDLSSNLKDIPDDCISCERRYFYYREERGFDLKAGVFFTAKACEAHIASNDYHYRRPKAKNLTPSLYAIAAWRNHEMVQVMRFLIECSGKKMPSHYL